MRSIFTRATSTAVLAAIGGGLASALLSMLTVQKTTLALAMGCLSPLPIMLAALSFGSLPGLIAAIIGTVAVGAFNIEQNTITPVHMDHLAAGALDSLVYAVSLGIPAWWLARVAATTRLSAPSVPAADQRKLGFVVTSAAAFAMIAVSLDFIVTLAAHGGFEKTMTLMTQRIEPFVQNLFSTGRQLPKGIEIHDLAVAMTYAQMPVLAAASLLLMGFNIWFAARITQASGRFHAPWPDLPRSLRLPRQLALLLAVALGLSLAGGIVGMFALIATGALTMAFATQGLALIHDVTRGKSFRLPLLIIVYLSLALLMPWLVAFYALVGLGDAGFSFRDRPRPAATGKS